MSSRPRRAPGTTTIDSSEPSGKSDERPWLAWLSVLVVLSGLYAMTAVWSLPYHIDPVTNAYTGWYLGVEGTTVAGQHEVFLQPGQRSNTTWFVESPLGPVSQYPPGAALTVAPLYAVTRPALDPVRVIGSNDPGVEAVSTTVPPLWQATLSAILVTALTCALITQVAIDQGATRRWAMAAGLVAGLATGSWSVASNMSWTHGPAMLAIAVSLLCFGRQRWLLGGLALGFGILVRPHVALVAAAVGFWVSWRRRDWRPMVEVGIGSGLGLVALLAYNRHVWQTWTITGGYRGDFGANLTSTDVWAYLGNVFLGLFAPDHGLLLWAPFLLVLVPAAWLARDRLPDWTVGAALGGLLYLLVQWKANGYAGGDGFFGYRYPLEALVAGSALLVATARTAPMDRPNWSRLLRLGIVMAVAGQAVGALAT